MSSADQYLQSIVSKYRKETGPTSRSYEAAQKLIPIIRGWAGETLVDIYFAGSYSKGTSIDGSTDIDLFILLDARTCGEMKELYENLYSYLDSQSLGSLRRNISIGLNYTGVTFDLLLARKSKVSSDLHELYFNKNQSCIETNVLYHTDLVANSGCREQIKAIKIWRHLNNLTFPSFYLELTILDVLANRRRDQFADNFLTILDYLQDNFIRRQILDPINSNNIISDDLTADEKRTIAEVARRTRLHANWDGMVW